MRTRLIQGALTVCGAIVLSTIGIFAADSLDGIDRNLVGLSLESENGFCKGGMVLSTSAEGRLCVDQYEASPSQECPHENPLNVLESEANTKHTECFAASEEGGLPWRFVSLSQAQRLCAAVGKRLPTPDEWYRLALGTEPDTCVVDEDAPHTASETACVSAIGAYNTVGNVWEWVDVTVVGRMFEERELPQEGYVSSVDASGVAITVEDRPEELYGEDYFWSKDEGVFGMIRGGYYGSETDAGLYTVNASVPTSFASQGVGFRCVEDV